MLKRYCILFLIIGCVLSACERDDICAANTPTTPLVQISFFDVVNRSNTKAINVNIREINSERFISYTDETIISVPLRTDTTATTYIFTKNPGIEDAEEDPENSDRITFTYNVNEVYIERACGFKVTYNALGVQPGASDDDDRWISSANVTNNIIVDDSTSHVSIFH